MTGLPYNTERGFTPAQLVDMVTGIYSRHPFTPPNLRISAPAGS